MPEFSVLPGLQGVVDQVLGMLPDGMGWFMPILLLVIALNTFEFLFHIVSRRGSSGGFSGGGEYNADDHAVAGGYDWEGRKITHARHAHGQSWSELRGGMVDMSDVDASGLHPDDDETRDVL
jgi:hypothetical protein